MCDSPPDQIPPPAQGAARARLSPGCYGSICVPQQAASGADAVRPYASRHTAVVIIKGRLLLAQCFSGQGRRLDEKGRQAVRHPQHDRSRVSVRSCVR